MGLRFSLEQCKLNSVSGMGFTLFVSLSPIWRVCTYHPNKRCLVWVMEHLLTEDGVWAVGHLSVGGMSGVLGANEIPGMTCASCAGAVLASLNQVAGVVTCAVAKSSDCATVEYDANQIQPEGILSAIEDTGFDAALVPPASAKVKFSTQLQQTLPFYCFLLSAPAIHVLSSSCQHCLLCATCRVT